MCVCVCVCVCVLVKEKVTVRDVCDVVVSASSAIVRLILFVCWRLGLGVARARLRSAEGTTGRGGQ